MTIAQKMLDERRMGFREGREETLKDAVLALKGILEPSVIAKQFKMPLEQVMKILDQE